MKLSWTDILVCNSPTRRMTMLLENAKVGTGSASSAGGGTPGLGNFDGVRSGAILELSVSVVCCEVTEMA